MRIPVGSNRPLGRLPALGPLAVCALWLMAGALVLMLWLVAAVGS
jgi:hypothetical protein